MFVVDLMRAMSHAVARGRTSQTSTGVALFGRGEPEKDGLVAEVRAAYRAGDDDWGAGGARISLP